MTKLNEKFQKTTKQITGQEPTLFDYSQLLDRIIKAAVAQSADDARLMHHVAPTLFYPFYDLTHKLAVARPGFHFTESEMKKTPFAQVLPSLQRGINKFMADPHNVVSDDFKNQLGKFLPAQPSRQTQPMPELAAA